MTISEIHKIFLSCDSVSTDTRNIKKNTLFVALKGERFDANTFALKALENGATYVIIDNKDYYIDEKTILVEDSLETLQKLAKFHREYLNLPIISLTGSNGKTTTKEIIQVVLSKSYNTKATVGNLNNHIGVPLTLLSFSKETQIGIVEMGANHQKEIEFLCNIAKPDFGYITNFGKAHLEGFGGVEGVIKGKSEMYNYLIQNNGFAFINLDDTIQNEKTVQINRKTFSHKDSTSDLYINSVSANPFVEIKFNKNSIQSNLIGLYNANNIAAAILIGQHFNVNDSDIKDAIENYYPNNNRSQIVEKNSNSIVLDAYNANPSSMEVALTNFIQWEKDNKLIVLGDMFELGDDSLVEHKNIISILENQNTIDCYFVGSYFYKNKIEKNNFTFFENFESFSEFIKNKELKNKTILIKGSRGMALERTLEFI